MPSLKVLYFLFFLCYSSVLFTQTNLDSLNALLPTVKGTDRVDLLNTIAYELKYADTNRASELCKESLDLANEIDYLSGEATALFNHATLLRIKGKYAKSFEVSEQSISLFKQLNNSLGVARNWNLQGNSFDQTGRYTEALACYEKALTITELMENEKFALAVKGNIAATYLNTGVYLKAIEQYKAVSSQYLEKGDSANYYRFLSPLGACYYYLGNYSEALPIFFEVGDFEKLKNRQFQLASIYNRIGLLYSKLELFDESLDMLEKALQIYETKGSLRRIGTMYLHIGNHYGKIEDLEKSDSFYLKTLEIYDSLGVEKTGAIYNNLGENAIRQKQYNKAINLLNKALEISKSKGIKSYIALNNTNLGTAYLELGEFKVAEEYFLKAMTFWKEAGNNFEKEITAAALAKIYKQRGNQDNFDYYSAIAQAANDSLFNKKKLLSINKLLIQNLQKEYENKSKEISTELSLTKKELAESENNTKAFLQKFAIPLLLIALLLMIGIFWLLKKHKRTSQLNKTLKNQVTEEQAKFESSLESKNKELALLSLETAQQTDLFRKIKDSLQPIIKKNPENLDIKKLEKILTAQSIGQDNWENFTTYFNEVYVGFFDRLAQSFPAITNKELRLCALIRLRIPTYEASIILGISPRSVHKSRYRIRKKMELDPEANMDEFICSI